MSEPSHGLFRNIEVDVPSSRTLPILLEGQLGCWRTYLGENRCGPRRRIHSSVLEYVDVELHAEHRPTKSALRHAQRARTRCLDGINDDGCRSPRIASREPARCASSWEASSAARGRTGRKSVAIIGVRFVR